MVMGKTKSNRKMCSGPSNSKNLLKEELEVVNDGEDVSIMSIVH